MIIFKIIKAVVQLLPWLLLAVLIYALWPLLHFVFTVGHSINHFFR